LGTPVLAAALHGAPIPVAEKDDWKHDGAAVPGGPLDQLGVQNFAAYAQLLPSLSFQNGGQNGGPGFSRAYMRGVANNFRDRRIVRGDDWRTTSHRFQRRQAKAFIERWEDKEGSAVI